MMDTPTLPAQQIETALRLLEGRWKLVILFHLSGGKVRRFSELERAIPALTQKMLGQQLRQLEADGIVTRTVYLQVPPKVEYQLTPWGRNSARHWTQSFAGPNAARRSERTDRPALSGGLARCIVVRRPRDVQRVGRRFRLPPCGDPSLDDPAYQT